VGRRVVAVGMAVLVSVASASWAEVLPVPAAVRELREPLDESHVLRTRDGTTIGEQLSRVVVSGDRLTFAISTHFETGEEWDEHGELDLADGFRSRRFAKIARRDGRAFEEQDVDFTTGKVAWLVGGVRAERTFAFAPDTYIGPMLAMILASVPDKAPATTSFQALVFRPDPALFTIRADAVDPDDPTFATGGAPASKLRVKPDLGPLQNVVLASLIPTHYFWFTRDTPRAFVAYAGALGNGVDVIMTPQRADATKTARAD